MPASLISPQRMPLLGQGRFIVDSQGNRAKLACVNWYGAHMETYVVGGLQVRHIRNITEKIVELGFNCVRLPYSLDLWAKDPAVLPEAIAANPQLVNLSALQVFDHTIAEVGRAGVVTILNNHNSEAGWCCDLHHEDGLWSTSTYNTSAWARSLHEMAWRYRDDPMVVGFDLRNEIHDVKRLGRITTWGTSDDVNTDWKLASELGGRAVAAADPSLLVVVSGMCFSFDLRSMHHDRPDLPDPRKLVWTVHYYSFSRWWTRMEERVVAVSLSVGCATLLLALAVYLCRKRRSVGRPSVAHLSPVCLAAACWLLVGGGVLLLASYALRLGYTEAGCEAMAVESATLDTAAVHLLWLGALSLLFSLLFACKLTRGNPWTMRELNSTVGVSRGTSTTGKAPSRARRPAKRRCGCYCYVNAVLGFCALSSGGGFIISLAVRTSTYAMLHDELASKWGLDGGVDAPVFVGEFGAGDGYAESAYWAHMIRFLQQYDLDWAYWPLNGDRWSEADQSWEDEWYGILDPQYESVRRPGQLSGLQSIQPSGHDPAT
ncbi:hypothetical protein AB1Y20_011343 [Prymnesium parvum]|uniref:Glycoside hydrolase family 5 domain-containing protein n=1 Tax=Prymnesium parvum TaxID=97485 RepID=A0AB34INZ9_PRYPA